MQLTNRLLVPIVAAVVAVAGDAAASQYVLLLDPAASHVSFTLKSTLHSVDGRLELVGGEVRFDPSTGVASGNVAFDAQRTETGNPDRDQKMHRKVLESDRFPEIVFNPERLTGEVPESGEADVVLAGTVTVHGASHSVSVPAHIARHGDRVHASATVPIPYVEWGMKDPSVLVLRVAKEVNVVIDLEGVLTR